MTNAGIERNLECTPYIYTLEYGTRQIKYHFSSHSTREKFIDMIDDNRREIYESLSNRFRMKFFISNDFCDVTLYRKLERRGFLIIVGEEEIRWLGQIEYNGRGVIVKREQPL